MQQGLEFGCGLGKWRGEVRRYGSLTRRMPRPRPAPARTPAAPPRRTRRCCDPCGTGRPRRVSAAAGAPRPHRGRHQYHQRHAHAYRYRGGGTAKRETAAGDRRTDGANRNGFSIRRSVSTASPAETRTAASLPGSPSGWPSSSGASTSTGQCHRYHEYDTSADRPASATMPGRGRIPEKERRSPRRSPAPHRARAAARRYPDRGWSCPTGCRPAGSPPALPTPRSRPAVPVVGATGWP